MVCYVLKEVRAKKSSVASVWLDTANVYGSIPHIVIIFCPLAIVESYFARIFSKSFLQCLVPKHYFIGVL